jgi:hypothetical protein
VIVKLLYQRAQSSPRALAKLFEKRGLARSNIVMHPKHLERQIMVLNEEIPKGLSWRAEDALQALAQTAGEERPG